MNKKHGKSPCCRERVRRFVERRRQCSRCKRTWRVWERKRGRKKLRVNKNLVHRFIRNRLLPTRPERTTGKKTRNKNQYRLSQSRHSCFLNCPWKKLPRNGKFIAVADALIKRVGRKRHTWYFVLVRPILNSPPKCNFGFFVANE